ncbi:MAG: OmpA family protein, partial [Spongiibacteraceae bacterium]
VEKTDSSLEIESLMGNLWFDFNPGEQLRPYVGFGLGLANASLSELEQEEVLIGQLGAGATYYLTHRLALDAGYRYTMSEDLEFTSGSAKFETEYSAHSVMLGLRYGFYDAIYGIQDTDGDGVADETDQCPGTPRGVQVDSVGCPLDGDGDGVADYLDQCPNTPAGTPVNEQGCVADNDNDGVADFRDACPDTAAGEEVMTNGCARDQAVVLRGVNFETNSAQLTVNAETILDSVGETLNTSPGFSVELQGHTDSVGADSYNMNLSQNRARAVKNYLVDQGVDSARLSASGYGEESPIADNDTSEGRAENRRVTLKVLASGDEEAVMEDAVDEFAAEEDAMEEAEEAMEEEAEAIEEAVEEEAEAYEDDMEDDFDEELEY